jgi:tetratricopeptide (TPR) repeat protein
MAFEQLGQNSKATNDLKRSLELLPTGEAYHSLGNLARKAGRLDQAKEYYAKIAGGKDELGQSAYGALVDLDLRDNPEKYINVKVGRDKEGHIVAQVSNPTPRNIGKIVLQLSAKDANGKTQQASLKIKNQVNAGKSKVIDLGLTGKLSKEQLRTLHVTITAADIIK